jgi:hypothetical protein
VLAFVDRREIDLAVFIKAQYRRDFVEVWPTDRSNYLNYSSENKRTMSTSRGHNRTRYRLMHGTSFDSGRTCGCFADFGFKIFVGSRQMLGGRGNEKYYVPSAPEYAKDRCLSESTQISSICLSG